MKKLSKLMAVILTLVFVASLFTGCDKGDNKEKETTTDGFTLQANNGDEGNTEEYTTQAEITTETTTKAEKTTKVKETTKVPSVTKAPTITKAPTTTKVNNITTVAPTTKPDATEKETLAPNVEKLLGCWEARYVVEDVTIYVQFEFKQDNSVETELTKRCYDKMINEIVDREAFGVTKEQLDSLGVDNATEYKEVLREYLHQQLPFDELKADFKSTGTWELEGDTLEVTIDGETAISDDGFMEIGLIFGLKFDDGTSISFSKIV